MLRAIVIGDLHFSIKNGEVAEKVLRHIYTELVPKLDAEAILFVGDLFHDKPNIPNKVVNRVIELFLDLDNFDIPFYAITGNHDQAGKSAFNREPATSSLEAVSAACNTFHIIDNSYVDFLGDIRVHGIPYYSDKSSVAEALDAVQLKKDGFNILMLHQTIAGIEDSFIPHEVVPHQLEQFDIVLCGHIHKRQYITDKVFNVGTPYQISLEEADQEKGIHFFEISLDFNTFKFVSLSNIYPTYQITNDKSEVKETEEIRVVYKPKPIETSTPDYLLDVENVTLDVVIEKAVARIAQQHREKNFKNLETLGNKLFQTALK